MVKRYTIEILPDDKSDGQIVRRTAENLTAYELIGMLEVAKQSIIDQINGNESPAKVEKRAIIDLDIDN